MGILSLPFALMLLAATAPGEGTALQQTLPMEEKAFRRVLLERDVSILEQACLDPMIATSSRRKPGWFVRDRGDILRMGKRWSSRFGHRPAARSRRLCSTDSRAIGRVRTQPDYGRHPCLASFVRS